WIPDGWYWHRWLGMLLHDALTATALLRTAIAVADDGLADGLARSRDLIALAPVLMTDDAAGEAARRIAGLTGIPARPGCYLRGLAARLTRDAVLDWRTASYVQARLARARDYGRLALNNVADLFADLSRLSPDLVRGWYCTHLKQWRAGAG